MARIDPPLPLPGGDFANIFPSSEGCPQGGGTHHFTSLLPNTYAITDVSGVRCQVPGVRCQVSGVRCQESDTTQYPTPATRYPLPDTQYPTPDTPLLRIRHRVYTPHPSPLTPYSPLSLPFSLAPSINHQMLRQYPHHLPRSTGGQGPGPVVDFGVAEHMQGLNHLL